MRWTVSVVNAVTVAILLAPAAVAQQGMTKQDRQGPVTVSVTPVSPLASGVPLQIRVVLDTHSVGLDAVVFEDAVRLHMGAEDVAPQRVEHVTGGGHHRQAVIVFPPPPEGQLRVVVRNVGGVTERVFTWDREPAR